MRLIYSQLSIQQLLRVSRDTTSCSWLQEGSWWVEWVVCGTSSRQETSGSGWQGHHLMSDIPWSWDSVEGKDQVLLHLYWTKLWWRNWGTWEENQNDSPASVPSTCHAICCHCQCHLGKSLLGWSTRTAAMGRAEMTSHEPEATVGSRNHRQSRSHSNQGYHSHHTHTAATRDAWVAFDSSDLCYSSVHNCIFHKPAEMKCVQILTLILWLLKTSTFACISYNLRILLIHQEILQMKVLWVGLLICTPCSFTSKTSQISVLSLIYLSHTQLLNTCIFK